MGQDYSLYSLFAANILTLILAVLQNWNLAELILVYVLQNVAIGFTYFLRMLRAQPSLHRSQHPAFSADLYKILKLVYAVFFLVHFSFFNLSTISFVTFFSPLFEGFLGSSPWWAIALTSLVFLVNHLWTYFSNLPQERKDVNVFVIMFYPYLRTLPTFLTLLLGVAVFIVAMAASYLQETNFLQPQLYSAVLIFFIVLKTSLDLLMHKLESNFYRIK